MIKPAAWTLTETIRAKTTTTSGYLWFTDPKNSAWTPLYAGPDVARLVRELREALDTCTPGDYSTGHVIHPSFDEAKVDAAIASADEFLKDR